MNVIVNNRPALVLEGSDGCEAYKIGYTDTGAVEWVNVLEITFPGAELDSLTNAVTAFGRFAELKASCEMGYVPTLFGRTRRERILIRVLKATGLKVWGNIVNGRRVNW